MVSGTEIKVNGQAIDPKLGEKLAEARIQQNLRLPDACYLRFADPGLENVDTFPLEIGSEIEVKLGSAEDTSLTTVFKGMVVSLEPEFDATGATLAVRAYDGSHTLNQTKRSETFQNSTASDIAKKVASNGGISVGTIDASGGPHDFVQQNNETDWEFLWRLAQRIDFEVLVLDHKLYFRKAGPPTGGQDITLKWGENLLNFKPRVTGVQQVDQVTVRARNPASKQPFEATERVQEPDSKIGITRSSAASALKGGTLVVADRPVMSQGEANDLAKSYAKHLAHGYLEAEGACKGNPRIKAGSKVKIDGIGTKYGGTYVVSSCTQLYQGAHGYKTLFSVSGRSPRNLVDLMTPKGKRPWGAGVVIGTVSNINDPDKLGRVRVKYPALGDETEGWWARIASPSAGTARGLLMLPQVGDEVLIAFEHGDVHKPYVLGSLWNGTAKPGDDLVLEDGSLSLQSDKQVQVHAKDVIVIKSDKDFTLETTGDITQKPSGALTIDVTKGASMKAQQAVSVESATGSVTVKGMTSVTIEATASLEIKCGAAKITLSSAGTVGISGTAITLG